MENQALFVDLPNFYSHLLKSGMAKPRLLRDYFLHWLDFDRLAAVLTGMASSVWVFYSGRRFGPSENRVEGTYLSEYVDRVNSLRGVTARDVNIHGTQREAASYSCEKCGHEGVSQWESEKGIDASLTVHLFDTMDSWDVAYLLSGDADFVPAVSSLRRRGKVVVGAGFSTRSAALVRECYDYVDLCDEFLRDDLFAFRMFGEEGPVLKWLYGDVDAGSDDDRALDLRVSWYHHPQTWVRSDGKVLAGHPDGEAYYRVTLDARGPVDLTDRLSAITSIVSECPGASVDCRPDKGACYLEIADHAWPGVLRRIEALAVPPEGWSEGTVERGPNCVSVTYSNGRHADDNDVNA